MLETKTCSECGKDKELTLKNYHGNAASRDGHRNKCKMCYAIERSVSHQRNIKITQLTSDNEQLRKSIQIITDKLEAFTIKCEIAEKKTYEYQTKYEILVEDLKGAGRWPIKG